jgi:transposase
MARSDQLSQLFSEPSLPTQRHYEICRAYYQDNVSARDLAERFQMHLGSVQSVVRDFAADPDLSRFFVHHRTGPKSSPKREAIEERACELRNQGKTLQQVQEQLAFEGQTVSTSYLFLVLRDNGLAERTKRTSAVPQPGDRAKDGSEVPAVANVNALLLSPGREFATEAAGRTASEN